MGNQQEGQGGQFGKNNKVPPMNDKKDIKKDAKQKKFDDNEEENMGSCSDKEGSCGSGLDDQEEE